MENDSLLKNEEANLVSEETNTVVSISQENENENGDVENTKKAEKYIVKAGMHSLLAYIFIKLK